MNRALLLGKFAFLPSAALAIGLLLCAVTLRGGQVQPPGRVLIVADEQKQLAPLAEFLRKEGGYDVQIVAEKEMPADLAGCHAVFQYIHGPMQDATGKALADYAKGGGRLVLLHHAIASARNNNPEFLRFVGMRIPPPTDPKTPWRVLINASYLFVNLQPRHYITSHNVTYDRTVEYQSPDAGGPAGKFPALDLGGTEAFVNQQFTDGREKTVLFALHVVDPQTKAVIMQDRAGWYKPALKGWVFYLQPGHSEPDFRNRNYCQIILNCLTWKPGMED